MKKIFTLITLFVTLIFKTNAQNLNPGDVSPYAKQIDAEEFFPFYDGAARIRNANAWALIDSSGNFIVPYHKYIFEEDAHAHLIKAKDSLTGKYIILNTKGEVIVPMGIATESTHPDNDGFVHVVDKGVYYTINYKKEKFIAHFPPNSKYTNSYFYTTINYKEGLSVYTNNQKQGYVNEKYETVIPATFDYADYFSDGMAVVGKYDEFHNMKYGFIDKTGKVVIDYQFSNAPYPFASGLSCVQPVDKTDFICAYINKKGEIVFKLKNTPRGYDFEIGKSEPMHNYNHLAHWYSGDDYYIDTLGNIMTPSQLLRIKLPENFANLDIREGYHKEIIYYIKGMGRFCGYINTETKKVLPPIFNMPYLYFYCDSESNLILTSKYISTDKKMYGYINDDGIFVIIQKPKSNW